MNLIEFNLKKSEKRIKIFNRFKSYIYIDVSILNMYALLLVLMYN